MTKIGVKGLRIVKRLVWVWLFFLSAMAGTGKVHAAAGPDIIRICGARDGSNTLRWRPYADTCEDQVKINVYAKENQFSNFKLIDSVLAAGQYEYVHKNANSFNKAQYYIEYVLRCSGLPVSRFSDTVKVDFDAPDIIEPDSVSVAADGSIIIGWTPEGSTDTKSYIVYRFDNNRNYPIDTLQGKYNTLYNTADDTGGQGKTYRYRLAVTDSCDNISPIGGYHQTIEAQLGMDTCKGEIFLSWTPYVGWPVEEYELYASNEQASGYFLIGTSKTTAFTFSEAKDQTQYYFMVRAVKSGSATRVTSSSNRIPLFTNFGGKLDYVYLKNVTVVNEHVELEWAVSDAAVVDRYEIWKGVNRNSFGLLAVVQDGTATTFKDHELDVNSERFLYKIRVYNTCGAFAGESNVSGNIVVEMDRGSYGRRLRWNPYEGWSGGTVSYDIYRNDNLQSSGYENIAVNTGNELIFMDIDSVSDHGEPGICYQVRAVEGDTNIYGFKSVSISNSVCYTDPPLVFIPNAFVPEGVENTRFAPVTTRVDMNNSYFHIYNRWGQHVYSTDDIRIGWDGKKDGELLPEGVYMYYMVVTGIDGTFHTYKGTITLLHN